MTCTLTPEEIKNVKGLGFLHNRGTNKFSGRIITVNGKITSQQNICLSEAADKFGQGEVTFTTRLTVEVPGIEYDQIQAFRQYLAQANLVTGGTGAKVRPVVSCKGTTCTYGLCDTFALAEEIHKRFFEGYRQVMLPHKFKIAVGGCPNNCVKPDLNDLGLIGQLQPIYDSTLCRGCKKCGVEKACPLKAAKVNDDKLVIDQRICNNCGRCQGTCLFDAISGGRRGYKIYIGGRWGKQVARGRTLSRFIEGKDEALAIIEKALLLFKDKGLTGERFAETIERLGWGEVEKMLVSDDLLRRKQFIIEEACQLPGSAA